MRTRKHIGGTLDDVTIILVLGAVGIGGYWLWKQFGGGAATSPQQAPANQTTQAAADLAQSVTTQPLSFPLSQYNTWSQEILSAGGAAASLTDSATILSIFSNMKNVSDVLQMITTFGTQTVWSYWPIGEYDYTLPMYLQTFMEDTDLQSLNSQLQSQGINYQF